MKKIVFLLTCILLTLTLNAQQTFTVNSSGFTFSPSELTVTLGDIVQFNVGSGHPVVQVSQATWESNGITPLSGGFEFPDGTGSYTTNTTGTLYYVCTNHVSLGMKGTITVNLPTAIGDNSMDNNYKLYPIPAKDFLICRNDSYANITDIRIMDLTGKPVVHLTEPVSKNEEISINVSRLNKGLYIVLVRSGESLFIKKFLKS